MVSRARRSGWRYRGNVAARATAAIAGGYALAASAAYAAARGWPLDRLQATVAATILAFVVMPAAAIWAFLAATPLRAWGWIAALAVPLAALGQLLGPHG